MATTNDGPYVTFRASTGLRQYQFVDIVKQSGSETITRLIQPLAGVTRAIGVLVSSGTTGSTGRAGSTDSGSVQTVQIYGISKVLSGSSAIITGDIIAPATDGRAAVASTNSTSMYMGRALGPGASTSSSAEVISVLLQPGGLI